MNRLQKQLDTAAKLLNGYDGSQPFHIYLNRQFKSNRQFGSSDRKFYKQACYGFWRFEVINGEITPNQVARALYIQGLYTPELDDLGYGDDCRNWVSQSLSHPHSTDRFRELISSKIPYADYISWYKSMAPVYLIPFPGKEESLRAELALLGLSAEQDGFFFKVQNSPLIQNCTRKGYCRVMDKASAMSVMEVPIGSHNRIWDCCCGAGGKTLLLRQLYPQAELYASDKRDNIVENLRQRFEQSEMEPPHVAVIDLSSKLGLLKFHDQNISDSSFDVIIADVPCSGSGTWRHTPEYPHFFDASKLTSLNQLQRDIVTHAAGFLRPQGYLVFITCSVFASENEENVEWLSKNTSLELSYQGYVGRKAENADYMFRAVFRKH